MLGTAIVDAVDADADADADAETLEDTDEDARKCMILTFQTAYL